MPTVNYLQYAVTKRFYTAIARICHFQCSITAQFRAEGVLAFRGNSCIFFKNQVYSRYLVEARRLNGTVVSLR